MRPRSPIGVNISWWRSLRVGSPGTVPLTAHGPTRYQPRLRLTRFPAATPTCSGPTTTNRSQMRTATTPYGYLPRKPTMTPMACSRPSHFPSPAKACLPNRKGNLVQSVATYYLGADEAERARLLAQCELHRREAAQLLDRVGVAYGTRVLDVGCGPLGVLDILSARVGPAGQVIGLDNHPRMLAYAEQTISERELANVELVQGDATRSGLPEDSFDGVHERLVLINHPSPQDIVREIVRVTRPGGWVAVQEVDMYSWMCEPGHPAWDELLETLRRVWRANG